ncbi:DUF262 domain-containing protein [Echinicola shivajiensis]|uniref:DUF262 domain-containing protein n=1 Tax=Echinicola shivajiensis TaxID=1035916 RepID=UPI001BFC0922|nr:DUF262 domain-containing protein [Echinicola shivajiensis]
MHPSEIKIGQKEISAHEIFHMIEMGLIDLDIDIDDVWEDKWKSVSIESIWLNLTMTPIYVDATNPKRWIVIDGKKRLQALHSFLKNGYPLIDLEFFANYDNYYFENLPRSLARKIEQNIFTIYSINQGVSKEVLLSIIYRIVPDMANGLGVNLSKKFLSENSELLIEYLESNPHFQNLLNGLWRQQINFKKNYSTYSFKLILNFIRSFMFLYPGDLGQSKYFNFDRLDTRKLRFLKEAAHNAVFYLNEKYANDSDFNKNLFNSWDNGLKKFNEMFEDHLDKRILFEMFDGIIIYFGSIISQEDYEFIINNRAVFLNEYFSRFRITIYKKTLSPKPKINSLKRLIEKIKSK